MSAAGLYVTAVAAGVAMCGCCQAEIDRAIGLMSGATRRVVGVDCDMRQPKTSTPFSDMCAALLVASKLKRAERCLSRLQTTAYGSSAAIVTAAVPSLCSLAVFSHV